MIEDQKWVQKEQKKRNRGRIIKLLNENPKRFTDLKNETGFSFRGLSTMLKDLLKEKKIEKIFLEDGKEAYGLTKGGIDMLIKMSELGFAIHNLREEDALYDNDFSVMKGSMMAYELKWGIHDDLLVDKRLGDKLNPITKKLVTELQEHIYNTIKSNIKNNKTLVDKTQKGDIVLGFIIDYNELIQSMEENSLEYLRNMTTKELDLYEKIESATITKKEMDLLKKIREKTKQKVKEMQNK